MWELRLRQVGAVDSVKTEGVGGALAVTRSRQLLDRIAKVEEDYGLPRGVESRRRMEYKQSYYELLRTTPEDIDQHIQFARLAGLRSGVLVHRIAGVMAGLQESKSCAALLGGRVQVAFQLAHPDAGKCFRRV